MSPDLDVQLRERRPKQATDDRAQGEGPESRPLPFGAALLRQLFDDDRRAGSRTRAAGHVLALQRTRGNQYVQGLVKRAQVQPQPAGLLARDEAAGGGGAGKTVFPAVNYTSYTIVATSLKQASAKVEAFQKVHGEAGKTTWNPKLSYALSDDKTLKSATVTVGITVKMPSWPGAAKASDAVRTEWNRAIAELRAHEDEHVKLVRDKMAGLGESLVGMSESDAKEAFESAKTSLQEASDGIDPYEVTVDLDVE